MRMNRTVGVRGLASLLYDHPKQLVSGAVTSDSSCVNVLAHHQLDLCVDLDGCTSNHEPLSEVQLAQVGTVIQRIGEVSRTNLDADQQENLRDAMTREIQSWLKYHAVKAAPRSQFGAACDMKMRWMLRFDESGSSQSTTGDHSMTCIGGEVRTEVPVRLHWSKEQVVVLTKLCHGLIDAPRRYGKHAR